MPPLSTSCLQVGQKPDGPPSLALPKTLCRARPPARSTLEQTITGKSGILMNQSGTHPRPSSRESSWPPSNSTTQNDVDPWSNVQGWRRHSSLNSGSSPQSSSPGPFHTKPLKIRKTTQTASFTKEMFRAGGKWAFHWISSLNNPSTRPNRRFHCWRPRCQEPNPQRRVLGSRREITRKMMAGNIRYQLAACLAGPETVTRRPWKFKVSSTTSDDEASLMQVSGQPGRSWWRSGREPGRKVQGMRSKSKPGWSRLQPLVVSQQFQQARKQKQEIGRSAKDSRDPKN